MAKKYIRLHFESEVYEADTPEQAIEQYLTDCGMKKKFPTVRAHYPCNELGMPLVDGTKDNKEKISNVIHCQ